MRLSSEELEKQIKNLVIDEGNLSTFQRRIKNYMNSESHMSDSIRYVIHSSYLEGKKAAENTIDVDYEEVKTLELPEHEEKRTPKF